MSSGGRYAIPQISLLELVRLEGEAPPLSWSKRRSTSSSEVSSLAMAIR